MDINKRYFLGLLSSYINEKQTLIPPDDIDWNAILELAKEHSVQVIIFLAVSKLNDKPPIYNELRKMFFASVNVSTKQEYWMNSVINTLTENNIDHLLMKGYVLRHMYPDKEARTFGDVDILIKEKDRLKCDELIKSLGFEFDNVGYDKEVWTYDNTELHLEVHTAIIYTDLFFDFDYINYFKNKVGNAQLVRGCTYELTKEDHYLYVMVHLAKHFYYYGVGIRMFLDIAVFLNKYKNELDFDYINTELEKMNITRFSNNVYSICKKYFETDIDCNMLAQAEENMLMEYILSHGVFGFDGKNPYTALYYKEGKSKTRVFFEKIFPDYETMCRLNSWYTGKPKILLPYAWIRRGFEFAFNERKLLGVRMQAILKGDDDIHKMMLKKIGLK